MATSILKSERRIVKKSFTKTGIASNTYYTNGSIDITNGDLTPIAVAGYNVNQAVLWVGKLQIVGNTVEYLLSRQTGTIANASLTVDILYTD